MPTCLTLLTKEKHQRQTAMGQLEALREARREIAEERQEVEERLKELDRKLKSYDDVIADIEQRLELAIEGDNSADPAGPNDWMQVPEWKEDASMPQIVEHIFAHVEKVMQPKTMDDYVRANTDKEVRDTAVSETLSRMARGGRLQRARYESASYSYYGLPAWWDDEAEDFIKEVKPDTLIQNSIFDD
jgi:DNA repair exonuclease SbcCD ATPase subunit